MPKQARSKKRYGALLNAAANLIAERGVDGFAFREVAQHAKVAHGSLYQYFPSREALVGTLHDRLGQLLINEVTAVRDEYCAHADAPDVEAVTQKIVEKIGQFYKYWPASYELRIARQRNDHIDQVQADIDQKLAQLIKEMFFVSGARLDPERVPIAITLILEAGNALFFWANGEQEKLEEVSSLFSRYLAK